MLKFHIFFIFNCEELVRIRAICEGLVRFFSDVKNWYSNFTNVKNRYQFNMSLRDTIYYIKTRGYSGQGSPIENDLL